MVMLSTAATLLALEFALRAGYMVRNRIHPPVSYVVRDGLLGWRPKPNLSVSFLKDGYGKITYTSTRHGFRRYGNVATPKVRLLAIGDSTTQAYHVPAGRAYFDFLATNEPRLEVFAVGVGGYSTLQETLTLEAHVHEISPDVVLWQFSANDLINNDWLLESQSTEHNNHMTRPYLVDGRILLRHPDGRLGWLARSSVLARRLLIARQSLWKRFGRPIEHELHPRHPSLRRSLATTREILERAFDASPGSVFLAFMGPLPGQYSWDAAAFAEICSIDRLRCVPGVSEAITAAKEEGLTIDGGVDPHWNTLAHELAGRAILDFLRREVLSESGPRPRLSR
jgi:hypothetical protein